MIFSSLQIQIQTAKTLTNKPILHHQLHKDKGTITTAKKYQKYYYLQ